MMSQPLCWLTSDCRVRPDSVARCENACAGVYEVHCILYYLRARACAEKRDGQTCIHACKYTYIQTQNDNTAELDAPRLSAKALGKYVPCRSVAFQGPVLKLAVGLRTFSAQYVDLSAHSMYGLT